MIVLNIGVFLLCVGLAGLIGFICGARKKKAKGNS